MRSGFKPKVDLRWERFENNFRSIQRILSLGAISVSYFPNQEEGDATIFLENDEAYQISEGEVFVVETYPESEGSRMFIYNEEDFEKFYGISPETEICDFSLEDGSCCGSCMDLATEDINECEYCPNDCDCCGDCLEDESRKPENIVIGESVLGHFLDTFDSEDVRNYILDITKYLQSIKKMDLLIDCLIHGDKEVVEYLFKVLIEGFMNDYSVTKTSCSILNRIHSNASKK